MSNQEWLVCRGPLKPGQYVFSYLKDAASFTNSMDALKWVMEDVQGFIDFYRTYGTPTKKQPLSYNVYEDGHLKHVLNFGMDGKLLNV